ncbi:MAG TPA: HAD family phosphatase [Candidatus Methylacidiphilales bacterium]|jgi:HAD superfamily hydrolase (TIGR01509 family)|nr:HAD family phosphatase [Candidatus Methylacidiphilales bacterium]
MSPNSGVIFDMDGLMVDTERIARLAWQQTSHEAGYEMPNDVFSLMIGRSKRDSGELMRQRLGPGFDFERVHTATGILFEKIVARDGLPLKPGIRELLDDLSARKIPLGVATSTRNPVASQRLEQIGLLNCFTVVVTGDQVTRGKPEPDIYLEAVRRLGIDARASYALEDSFAGVRSAHAAGLRVIMVPDLLQPIPEIAALTHAVAKSLHDARLLFREGQPPA